jgi:2-furoate---CoA ligase
MDLGTAFAYTAARDPGREAFVEGARRVTYGAWYDEVRSLAGGLAGLGLRPGDTLAVVMRNRYEMASLYWAAQLSGLVFAPLSWRGSADEIAYCLEDCEAKAIAYDGAAGDAAPEAATRARIDRAIVAADATGEATAYAHLLDGTAVDGPTGADEESPCLMLYTSGTTGRPKGVPRSHRAELTAAVSHIAHNRYAFATASLGVMPLFHTMGIRVLLVSALLNGRYVAVPEYGPEEVLRLIAAERVENLFLVPTMFHDMLRHERFGRHDLGSLSRVGYAGMTMTPALIEHCLEALRPELFVNYYGSSEIYTFTFSDRQNRKPGSAGRPGLNQSIRVVPADSEGRAVHDEVLAAGQPGEIIASMASPEAFKGYWRLPEADAKAIRDGWYYTGDLGQWDKDGELTIMGRVDDMIISGAENIYPEEVEDVAVRSGLAADVAVIGMADARLGQRVVAFVEPAMVGLDAQALDQAYLASPLPRFKRPREYVFVKRMPRSASGKLLRRLLREGEYEALSDD